LTSELGVLKDYGEYGWLARATFLLDADGVVQQVWDVTDAEAHPDEVLAAVSGCRPVRAPTRPSTGRISTGRWR
jgi:peroxiredoxin